MAGGTRSGGSEASIKDVARRARVSIASVSRVMNGHDNVAQDIKERVLAAVRDLDYVPHSGARSLITQRTNVIGVLLPDLHGEFFSEIIRGADAVARDRKLQLLLSSAHGDAAQFAAAVRTMRGKVDGLLVMSPHVGAAALEECLPRSLPIVLLNGPLQGARYPTLTIDSYQGARAMVAHLVARGHRRIAHVAGPEANFDARERLRGYLDEMAHALPRVLPRVEPGDFTERSGYLAGQRLAALDPASHPDAVFAANDVVAVGLLVAFREAGLAVPGDVAVAGFDDIPLAALVSPALTTVRVRIADLGRAALEELLRGVEAPEGAAPTTRSFLPELVIRASCGSNEPAAPRRQRRPTTRVP